MNQAKSVKDAVTVNLSYELDGQGWIETDCQGYDGLVSLPKVLEFEGRRYGQTGWNSDRNVAYYCTSKAFAIAH
jgi:hypothetical protein